MRFTPGLILDPEGQQARDEAIEASEQSRAARESANRKPPARPGWKAYKRPSETETEIDAEISIKMKKGKI